MGRLTGLCLLIVYFSKKKKKEEKKGEKRVSGLYSLLN